MTYNELNSTVRSIIVDKFKSCGNVDNIAKEMVIPRDLIYQILFENQLVPDCSYKPSYRNRSYEWKCAVAEYYQNHSRFETRKFFHTSSDAVDKVLQEFNIPRRSHKDELELAKINKYGSIAEYRTIAQEKYRQTSVEKYGVDNFAKSDLFKKKSVSTSLERYGVTNPMQSEEVKKKLQDSVMKKYGVPWYCMTDNCRTYSSNNSAPNREFAALLEESGIEYEKEFHIENKSFDFRVGRNLIEINPTSTHNSTWGIFGTDGIPPRYHCEKSNLARTNGYRCICIWDWDNAKDIINQLLIMRPRLYARKCILKIVGKEQEKQFLIQNHIQGYVKSDIALGLYYQTELVSLMTFGKPRYNKNYQYELLRYCSSYNVVGGAQKLFKHFVDEYTPKSIISYCDWSKFNGDTYLKLGFKLKGEPAPSKHWYSIKTGRHITDNLLRQRGFDQLFGTNFGKGSSNEELMRSNDFVEIYDCGQAVYYINFD